MPSRAGINSRAWRTLRLQIIKQATHCYLCSGQLYPNAPPRSRWSTSVDHVHLRKLGGVDPLDPSNFERCMSHAIAAKKTNRGQQRDALLDGRRIGDDDPLLEDERHYDAEHEERKRNDHSSGNVHNEGIAIL